MATAAIVVELADRDAVNARHAARIPPVCNALPTGIESRAKTLRFTVVAGLAKFDSKPASRAVRH
jgi:hypothetical protein